MIQSLLLGLVLAHAPMGMHRLTSATVLDGSPTSPPQIIACSPDTCNAGDSVMFEVVAAASSQAQTFSITESDPSAFTAIPSRVTIPANATAVYFQATTSPNACESVEVSAENSGGSVHTWLMIN